MSTNEHQAAQSLTLSQRKIKAISEQIDAAEGEDEEFNMDDVDLSFLEITDDKVRAEIDEELRRYLEEDGEDSEVVVSDENGKTKMQTIGGSWRTVTGVIKAMRARGHHEQADVMEGLHEIEKESKRFLRRAKSVRNKVDRDVGRYSIHAKKNDE